MFEVRTENTDGKCGTVIQYCTETRRTNRKDAEQDVDLLKLFGKAAWIVEV